MDGHQRAVPTRFSCPTWLICSRTSWARTYKVSVTSQDGSGLEATITGNWHSWISSRPALASKDNRYPKDPWPDQADNLTCRGRPKLGPRQLESLEGVRMEANRPLIGAGKFPPQTRVERHPPQTRVERHPPPARAANQPLQAEVGSKPPQGAWLTHPQRGRERVTVHGMIGTKGPSGGLKGERPSPKALPTQLGLHR